MKFTHPHQIVLVTPPVSSVSYAVHTCTQVVSGTPLYIQILLT